MVHRLTLYGKPGCCLCDNAKDVIARLRPDYEYVLDEVDITSDPKIYERYRYTIPVVVVDGKGEVVTRISEYRLRQVLEAQR